MGVELCAACGKSTEASDSFCAGCGAPVITIHDITITVDGRTGFDRRAEGRSPARRTTGPSHRPRLGSVGALMAGTAIAASIIAYTFTSQDQAAPESTAPTTPTPAQATNAEPAVPDSVAGETVEATVFGASTDRLVLLVDGQLDVVDMATGERSTLGLPEPNVGSALAAAGDRVVYRGSTTAWAVGVDDSQAVARGPADAITDSRGSDLAWLGVVVPDEPTNPSLEWREVNSGGEIFLSTVRSTPMEFSEPGLVWGFDSSMHRLTRVADRPWRFITVGTPVATGPNDLIVNQCNAARQCERVWFDLETGEDAGRVLADVAGNIDRRYGGSCRPRVDSCSTTRRSSVESGWR